MRTALALLVLLAGCPDRTISKVDPQQQGAVVKKIPVSADIDLLFVIDNSASTQDKQTVFAANFPKFVQALDGFSTGRPNLHIGVVDSTVDIGVMGFGPGCPSPDPADNGLLQTTLHGAGCLPFTGSYLSDIKDPSGARMTNYGGTLEQELSCIAQVGAMGCGFEAPLEAMKRALDGSIAQNAGFIRKGAYLGVIFLTDEDDASVKDKTVFTLPGSHDDYRVQPLYAYSCDHAISPTAGGTYKNCVPRTDSYLQDPAYYAQALSAVKDPSQLVVAAIAGPPPGLMTDDVPAQTANSQDITIGPLTLNGNVQPLALQPSCSATINGQPAIGRPGVRLASFLGNFGDRGRYYSVCQGDYSAALTDIGKTLFNAISPCLEGDIDMTDTNAANPGLQPDCTVSDVQNDSTHPTETPIAQCQMTDPNTPAASGPRPCWWVKSNPASCTTETMLELHLERSSPPAIGTSVDVECATKPTM